MDPTTGMPVNAGGGGGGGGGDSRLNNGVGWDGCSGVVIVMVEGTF